MKIYPRIIELKNGLEECTFYVKNTSVDDKVLLFKVRRSDPQLVTFTPKRGIIEPGKLQSIIALYIRNVNKMAILTHL